MDLDGRRRDHNGPACFRITVRGHLGSAEASWFEGLEVSSEYEADGTPVSVIFGEVLDQSMLHGLLARIRDLGLPLLGVVRIGPVE